MNKAEEFLRYWANGLDAKDAFDMRQDLEELIQAVMDEVINDLTEKCKEVKLYHELPNDNEGEYNRGVVKSMNVIMNHIKN